MKLRGQFGIGNLLLIVAVAAAWTSYVVSERRSKSMEEKISVLQASAGRLAVRDKSKYQAISQVVVRFHDEAWQAYLPEGRKYQVHLATREIRDQGFPTNASHHVAEVSSGTHEICIRVDQEASKERRFTVLVDDHPVIEAPETADWNESGGTSATGVSRTQNECPISEPLVLKRLRCHDKMSDGSSTTPPGDQPANGLLLWITAGEVETDAKEPQ